MVGPKHCSHANGHFYIEIPILSKQAARQTCFYVLWVKATLLPGPREGAGKDQPQCSQPAYQWGTNTISQIFKSVTTWNSFLHPPLSHYWWLLDPRLWASRSNDLVHLVQCCIPTHATRREDLPSQRGRKQRQTTVKAPTQYADIKIAHEIKK